MLELERVLELGQVLDQGRVGHLLEPGPNWLACPVYQVLLPVVHLQHPVGMVSSQISVSPYH